MGKIITVVSGKSGMGKTTTVAALSSSLAILGNKTLCLDFGKGENNLVSALCINDCGSVDHIDVHGKQGETTKAGTEHPEIPGLFVLPMPSFLDLNKPDISEVMRMFTGIRHEFDYCIVDTPPVSYPGFNLAIADADMTIIVTTGEIPSLVDVLRAAKATHDTGCNDIKLLVNRTLPEDSEQKTAAIDKMTHMIGAQLIGLVPDSDTFSKAMQSKMPLVRFTKTYVVYNYLCIAHMISSMTFPAMESDPPPPVDEKPCTAAQPDDRTQPSVIEEPNVPVSEEPSDPVSEEPSAPDSETVPFDIPDNLLGSYGDSKLWAQSTLNHAKIEDLVEIYAVMQSPFIAKESVRNRMWLHDLLDDNGVPYYIEVNSRRGSKELVETQHIFVEKKNAGKAVFLLKKFNEAENIVRVNPDEDSNAVISDDGIPQKKCPTCDRDIDFDYHKCPYCKGKAG